MYLPTRVSALLYQVADVIQRRGLWPAYKALERSQWWDAPRLAEQQTEKLRRRVVDLASRSPLLADRLQEAGVAPGQVREVADLKRVPILEKADLRERKDELITRGWSTGDLTPWSSGGSTGQNVSFFVDRGCWVQRDAAALRMFNFLGLGPGARIVNLWGQPWDLNRAGLWKRRIRRAMDNYRIFSAYRVGPKDLDVILEWMDRHRPEVLMGFASILDQLAQRALSRGGLEGPRFVISCAEALFPDQRGRMEKAWGADVFNQYGSREFGVVAMECGEKRGLHVFDERVILEFEAGDGMGDGTLLVTDLDNRATPFLRYRIGDDAERGEPGACPCGRGLSRMAEVHGRSFDIIRGADGRAVGGTFFSVLLRTAVKGVESFQVQQHAPDRIEIRFTPPDILHDDARSRLVTEIREVLGEGMKVEFSGARSLPVLPSGKHRFVVGLSCGPAEPERPAPGRADR